MDISSYYQHIIKELEASARDASKQVEQNKLQATVRLEEAQISASASPKKTNEHSCDAQCNYDKLRNKFSSIILAKLREYGLDASNFTPAEARKRLLSLGMPMEYALLDLQKNGKDISAVENLLAKHGLSSQLNSAVVSGITNNSMSSAIAFAEGLIAKAKPQEGQTLSQTV